MKITILHNERGEIIAISKIDNLQKSGSKFAKAGMLPARGQSILETELSSEHQKHSLSELHEHYRVDISAAKLVKK